MRTNGPGIFIVMLLGITTASTASPTPALAAPAQERQLTTAPHGHVLTNINVWSPDGRWIVYDVRTGDDFNGTRIEQVNADTAEVRQLYESRHGANCGVVTYSPAEPRIVFIHGPENPTPDWPYGFTHRRGALVDARRPGEARPLDAMTYAPPFMAGALRGGSHVHVFSPDGQQCVCHGGSIGPPGPADPTVGRRGCTAAPGVRVFSGWPADRLHASRGESRGGFPADFCRLSSFSMNWGSLSETSAGRWHAGGATLAGIFHAWFVILSASEVTERSDRLGHPAPRLQACILLDSSLRSE